MDGLRGEEVVLHANDRGVDLARLDVFDCGRQILQHDFSRVVGKAAVEASASWPSLPAMSMSRVASGLVVSAPWRRISSTGKKSYQSLRFMRCPNMKLLKFAIVGGSEISQPNMPNSVLCATWKGPGTPETFLNPVFSR